MAENFIINSIAIYFLGLILASVSALSTRLFAKATLLFVLANLVGFFAGAAYLWSFPGQRLVIADFGWLFHFVPSLNVLSGVFFTAISGVSALVGVYSLRYLPLYQKAYHPGTVQSLTALFVLGMQGVLLANSAFAFLFFWEVMSITSFFLVMVERTQESLKAAFLYFIMTHLGASAILGGFLVLSNGSLAFELQNIASASQGLSPALLALTFVLFLFGFGSKAGLVPFHVWLPEAHPQAPSNISAMMSGLMLKVAVYGFITVVFSFARFPQWAGMLVIALGLLSGIVGALYALVEKDIKRVFAYSSIENMGIIFTMLGLALYLSSRVSLNGIPLVSGMIIVFAIFHALSHMLFKTGLFLSSGVIISRVHSKSLEAMGGIAKLMPIFSFAFLLVILGSLPIAPFSTFYGEWGFIQTIVGLFGDIFLGANETVVLLIVLSLVALISGLAIFAMVRVFGISMLGLSRSKHLGAEPEKQDRLLTWPILGLSASLLLLGIFARPAIDWLSMYVNLSAAPADIVRINSTLSSSLVFVVFVVLLVLAVLSKKLFAPKAAERVYQTWDCGQPIDSTMEYTATAFSAPIRFFFLRFLGSRKMLSSTPVVSTNPWIRKYSFSLTIASVWTEKLYRSIAGFFIFLADRAKKIQGGRVQYYLIFLLITLIVTLIIAL